MKLMGAATGPLPETSTLDNAHLPHYKLLVWMAFLKYETNEWRIDLSMAISDTVLILLACCNNKNDKSCGSTSTIPQSFGCRSTSISLLCQMLGERKKI